MIPLDQPVPNDPQDAEDEDRCAICGRYAADWDILEGDICAACGYPEEEWCGVCHDWLSECDCCDEFDERNEEEN